MIIRAIDPKAFAQYPEGRWIVVDVQTKQVIAQFATYTQAKQFIAAQ